MSKKETPDVVDQPTGTSASTKAGRRRKGKAAAVIVLITAVAIGVVFALFALLPRKADGFIIELDYNKDVHFTMTDEEGETQEKHFLRGDPLGNGWPVLTSEVRSYYDALKETPEGLHGSQNFIEGSNPVTSSSSNSASQVFDETTTSSRNLALVYTFYLRNNLDGQGAPYRLTGRCDTRVAPTNDARNPYDYLRVALFESNVGEADDFVRYYGNANVQRQGTLIDNVEDFDDDRECVSTAKLTKRINYEADEERELRTPLYIDKGHGTGENGIGFCENFDNQTDFGLLFNYEAEIQPGKTRRITIVAYLEAKDPDCVGTLPKGAQLGLSLSVGV